MVSNMKWYASDPNPVRYRGAGWYYHRGNGDYSKYDLHRDGQIKHEKTVFGKEHHRLKSVRNPKGQGVRPDQHKIDTSDVSFGRI